MAHLHRTFRGSEPSTLSRSESKAPVQVLAWTLCALASLLFVVAPASAGGTPDPGTTPLQVDGGDADALPDNENQLIGILGARRGFGFGDYVSDAIDGLQSTIGPDARYEMYIEVPPAQTNLTVEIFDADTGAGDLAGTEEHDQDDTSGWDTITTYTLIDPDGATVASITLGPQDCDPVTVGLQAACNNTWSDLGIFSVLNPAPGHWTFTIFTPDGAGDRDDNNSFGVRAHDGDATASGTEYNLYADTYVGIGHVYADSFGADPGLSRTYDFYPYVLSGCECDANDWDSDDAVGSGNDETIDLAPQNPVAGATASYDFDSLGDNGVWNQSVAADFTSEEAATSYGTWDLRFVTGRFNFITFWMGSEAAADPVLPPTSPGAGAEPDQQPEAGAIRLYFPADGSRFFGERGGADDATISPTKPSVGQSWAVTSGPDPVLAGATSRIRVTITIDNPTAWPIQLSDTTAGSDVVQATVPTNGGQTEYVTGSATVNNAGVAASTATSESGTGPWNLVFAPGVIDSGDTVTLTYDIDVTPSSTGTLALTGAGPGTGTRGSYLDETCAQALGGPSLCTASAQSGATVDFGPLCELEETVTAIGTASLGVTKTAGMVSDIGGGQFQTTYTVEVENLGTANLENVSVTDDLSAAFPAPATFSVSSGPTASGTLAANGSYDGSVDTDLVVPGSSTLAAGASSTITYTVQFDPNGLAGPFTNTADGSADPVVGGTPVTDSDTAQVTPTENPQITVGKSLSAPTVDNMDGTFTANFQVDVSNSGNVDLDMVQVVDDLDLTFPAPATIDAVTIPVATGTLVANAGYDGQADTDLLNGAASTLAVGDSASITFSVTFDPAGDGGPFTNTASGSAESPAGTTVQDSDDQDVTVTPGTAQIGIFKNVDGAPVDNMDGTFTVDFVLGVENLGDVALTDVQVTDDLSATFPAPASVVAVTTPVATITGGAGTLTANPGYDGDAGGDTELLVAATSDLGVGATGEITFSVTFDPAGETSFLNTAVATADSGVGPTSDTSDDGTDADPNGNGNPDEAGENDPTPISVSVTPSFDIPTTDTLGLLLLALALLGVALPMLRRS